jgi:hypothetical protein
MTHCNAYEPSAEAQSADEAGAPQLGHLALQLNAPLPLGRQACLAVVALPPLRLARLGLTPRVCGQSRLRRLPRRVTQHPHPVKPSIR